MRIFCPTMAVVRDIITGGIAVNHTNGYDQIVAFHGHSCPGLAIGIKASELALRELGEGDGDEELVCVSETDMCGVDGIQYMTNCTLGKGNLILRNYGKVAFTFYRRKDGKGIRLVLKDGLKREMEREEYRDYLLKSNAEDLFDVKTPREPLPSMAYRETSLICSRCGEGTMESLTRNLEDQIFCIPCFREIRPER